MNLIDINEAASEVKKNPEVIDDVVSMYLANLKLIPKDALNLKIQTYCKDETGLSVSGVFKIGRQYIKFNYTINDYYD